MKIIEACVRIHSGNNLIFSARRDIRLYVLGYIALYDFKSGFEWNENKSLTFIFHVSSFKS